MKWMLALPLILTQCGADETLTAYAPQGVTFEMAEIDGTAFPATATLTLSENGAFSGRGPCNAFSGQIDVPYPWFNATQLAATERACPQLPEEQYFFDALTDMTLAEWSGAHLILTNDTGREMVFAAQP